MPDLLEFLRSISGLKPSPARHRAGVDNIAATGLVPVEPALLREQQNDWIKKRHREWQVAWHDAFDADLVLQASGELDRPDPLPNRVGMDYRLIFEFSHATPETRSMCFSLFPSGSEMHRRFENFLTNTAPMISETEARGLVGELAKYVDAADPDEQVNWTEIILMDRRDPAAQELLSRSGPVSELFTENLLAPTPKEDLPAEAARIFLTEPLYASCGNFYELRDWVTGAMFDPRQDKVFEYVFRLWNGGWQPLLSSTGVILAFGHRG
jgi:hypothetical protein